ncbi:MAG: hypothetical protein KBT21_03770 [Treponema sp.]|nr:hypothetical protein [Candidatus Treponema merdequi]
MIVRILLVFLFVIFTSFILYFIYGVFIPAIKSQTVENKDPLFSEVELNYVGNMSEKTITVSDKTAVVLCNPDRSFSNQRLSYNGIKSCALFHSIYETSNDCAFGCIGFGDCVKKCPQEAIIIKNSTAIITKNCCGCGECISSCPKDLIKLYERKALKENSEIKLCNASENCLTSCNKCQKLQKVEFPEQKNFKFWKSCYKIFNRK